MSTLPTPTADAPDSPCPHCGAPSTGLMRDDYDGVTRANYLCAAGHIWQAKWLSDPEDT